MRVIARSVLASVICFKLPIFAAGVFGVWQVRRSINAYNYMVMVRFEPHPKGEVFTLDVIEPDGRSTTSSTILYLDSKARAFEGFGCSGTQSSRRLKGQTVEIVRTCNSGEWTRFVRRLSADAKALVLEITEQGATGRYERKLILEKQ